MQCYYCMQFEYHSRYVYFFGGRGFPRSKRSSCFFLQFIATYAVLHLVREAFFIREMCLHVISYSVYFRAYIDIWPSVDEDDDIEIISPMEVKES